MLNVVYLNARSLSRKLPDLEILAADKQPDLILITETWCNSDIQDAMLRLKDYYFDPNLRVDRHDTQNGIGGGLIIYVRHGLTILPCDNNSEFNQFASFKLLDCDNTIDSIFTLVYRSPNSNSDNNEKLCELFNNFDDNVTNFIVGDFNMPDVDWKLLSSSNKHKTFLDTVIDKAFYQLVDFPTHNKGNILDLVFTNCPDRIANIENIGNLANSDHCILSIDILCDSPPLETCDMIPNFYKMNTNDFTNYLENLDLENKIKNLDCNEGWNVFKNSICDGIEKFVPKQKRNLKSRPVWINKHVIRLCRQKRRRFAIYCKDRSDENLRIYKKVEKQCKNAVRRAKRNFEKKLSQDSNKKPFNAYMKSKTKSTSNVGPLKVNGNVISDSNSMATILNDYFSSIFTQHHDKTIPHLPPENFKEELKLLFITKHMVEEKLKKLKDSPSSGPDCIPSLILKRFSSLLAGPLAIIFNKSIRSSVVPEDWLLGNVTPIYKKGSKCKPEHYRPVSLTCICCKVLESFIKDCIVKHIQENNLLRKTQHGFLKGRSCTTNLLEFLEQLINSQENLEPVDVVYLDFAKAFDKVPVSKLLAKVKAKGISGNIFNWIKSWLTNRKQRVVLNGKFSSWLAVLSGVPQGSVLGPLLFLIFIDDLDDFAPLINILSKFADDTKLGHTVISQNDKEILQSQLDSLTKWADKWGMEFNVSKCKVMHLGSRNNNFTFTMNGEILSVVDREKDIGVTFNESLKPGLYCKEAARIARGVLFQISRSFHYRDRHVFLNLYKRYVRVHLEFATPVWSTWQVGDITTLEKVQQKAVGMISGLKGKTYEEKLKELNLPTLEKRRYRADLIQLFKILNDIDSVEARTWFQIVNENRPNTRAINSDHGVISFQIPVKRTDLSRNVFSVRAAKFWNDLPVNVKKAVTLSTFKKRLDNHIQTLA